MVNITKPTGNFSNDTHRMIPAPGVTTVLVTALVVCLAGLYCRSGLLTMAMWITAQAAMPTRSNLLMLLQLRRVILSQRHWTVVTGIVKASRDGFKDDHIAGWSSDTHFLTVEYDIPDMDGKKVVHAQKEFTETVFFKPSSWYWRGTGMLYRVEDTATYQRPANGSEMEILVVPGSSKSGVLRHLHLDERRRLMIECVSGAIYWTWLSASSLILWKGTAQEIGGTTALIWSVVTGLICLPWLVDGSSLGQTILERARSEDGDQSADVMDDNSKA